MDDDRDRARPGQRHPLPAPGPRAQRSRLAYSDEHAVSIREAWFSIDATERGDTVLPLVVTDGSDRPVYFGN